jgi:2,4-dienoyl-CoA reductase-like NADH-dependent reductase (Old Yellow Enzyme family)/NADPH-dependent 2,4-dienoyl-CoA reductase/sulfur reductase-like enzyme
MSEYKLIFEPIRIGRMMVKNRIEFPPVGPHLGTGDGYVSRELIEWGRQFARGGAGIVTLGDTSTVTPSGPPHQSRALHLGNDKCVNPLNRFAETIQRYGAKASIQLNYHSRFSPTEMSLEDIKTAIDAYTQAAYRCLTAGMDMIMVHGAHGHILSQFLSSKTNQRTDSYGGSLENRARFAISVLESIRNKVGDRLAIEYRISGDELVPWGPTPEEQVEFAQLIQDKIDLIHISVGNLYAPETLPMLNQPTYYPRGLNIKYAEVFKKALKIPVATVGSYNLKMAEQILGVNQADIVAMARTLIADPDCVRKAAAGKADQIRPCIRCNNCINRSHELFLSTRCSVNPVIGREDEFFSFPLPRKKKKVVVVGGGPAGMEAARTAADKGHEVVLFEKDDRLGGTLTMAAAAPFKTDMRNYLDWAVRETLNTNGLSVRLSTTATTARIEAEKPDVLIIAAGSTPVMPQIPGNDSKNVVWAGDVELGKAAVGENIAVVGAGLTGSETALHLAQEGKRVMLIDMQALEKIDTGASVINTTVLRKLLKDSKVDTFTGLKLTAITESGIEAVAQDSQKVEIPCDTVVLALGMEPRSRLVVALEGLAPEIYMIGDCHNQQGNLLKAVAEGFFAAMEI